MKDTCKSWLQVITACLSLSATTWGQSFELGSPGSGSPSSGAYFDSDEDYGSVRLGGQDHSASAYVPAPNVQQAQFVPGAPPMFNDAMIPADESIGFAATRPVDRILWRVGNSSLDNYGFDGGYTNLNAFIPFAIDSDRSLWWINPRVNISDFGDGSASVGMGYRVYVPEDDRVYGASFWWDNETAYTSNFNQLGGSFESLGRYTDLRMNFALPIGNKVNSAFIRNTDASFVGNQISLAQLFLNEEAMQTYDAEVATPFPGLGDFGLELGLGIYYLAGSQQDNAVGVSARAQAQINDNFWLNGVYTNDDTFGSNFSINFELTMPASGPVRWMRPTPVAASLTESVQRRYRIPVNSGFDTRHNAAINPKTGAPYTVAHIDPNLTGLGTGTINNPFMSLDQFDSLNDAGKGVFDIIYVRPRTDETDVNLNTGIEILGGQRLLSNSVPHTLESNGTLFQMPGFVANQPLPFLTSSGMMADSAVVTLRTGDNYFEVSGFQISHEMTLTGMNPTVGSAIFGDGVSDVSINRNILENSEFGTLLTDFSGSLHYRENVLRNNTVGGLSVEYTGDGQLALFSNTTFNNMGIGFEVIADGAAVAANNLPEAIGTNPAFDAPNFGTTDAFVNVNGTQDSVFPFDPATMATGIQGNLVDLNETGMLLESINGGSIVANVENNIFSNNQNTFTGGFLANADGVGSSITLETFLNNESRLNVGNGVLLSALNGGDINTPLRVDPTDPAGLAMIAGFSNNLVTQNVRNGIAVVVENSDVDDIVLGNNTVTENGDAGIGLFLDNATFAGWRIENNIISENEEDGVALIMLNGTVGQDLTLINNTINNNQNNGYNVIAEDSMLTDLIIDSNMITGNGALGSAFDITLAFNTQTGTPGLFGAGPLTALTPAEQAIVQAAARRWEELIIGDVVDVNDPMFQATFGTIDDILLFVDGEDYGGSGVLGVSYGMANMYRQNEGLPFWGLLTMINDGTLDVSNAADRIDYFSIALHEIGHSLGFQGLSFSLNEAATGNNIFDPATSTFVGPSALAEHNAAFGVNETFIQLQQGSGHWGDPRYAAEFMFPSIALGSNTIKPQSRMTVGLMEDLGYVVNLNAADPFPPGGPVQAPGTTFHPEFIELAPGQFNMSNINFNSIFQLDPDSSFDVAQANAGGQHGIQIDLTNSEITNVTMTDNLLDSNIGNGFRAELRGASLMNLNSSRDMITDNGQNGMGTVTRGTSVATVDVQNALITGNGQNGFLGEVFNDTRLDVSFTSPTDPLIMGITNISNNGANGVSIISRADSPIINTSEVTLFVEQTRLADNGQRGVNIQSTERTIFDEILIQDNIITGNGTDGIGMARSGNGFINGTILRNMVNGNSGNGIDLLAQNAFTTDTYLIQDNEIRSNTDGIHLRVEADGIIDATINNNLIQSNTANGIHVTDRANSALDQRYVTGTWTQNRILNNGGDGIALDGSYGVDNTPLPALPVVLEIGLNGVDMDGFTLGNLIDGNGGWGIQSTAVGAANIHNNRITNNGSGGINIDSILAFGNIIGIDNNYIGQNDGIGIEMRADGIVFVQTEITNNVITENTGDGIEFSTLNLAGSDVFIDNNVIFLNDGRGIDILNAGLNPTTVTTINNNVVDYNGGEGVYVVNTSSVSQYLTKDGPTPDTNPLTDPTHGMDATGRADSRPLMVFNMDNNVVTNNGLLSDFDATGFVMRVGTSDGDSRSTTFDGGYASEGFGGVIATITNNAFSGNFGTDVWFESFTSTVDPGTTTGAWSQTEFNITGNSYRSDPLARLDLVFTGNTGDSIQVTNVGAWYDNEEPIFKSRGFFAAPNISGPFQAAGPSRRRNAQRLAARDALPPVVGPGLTFLYPGMGTSTFRATFDSVIGLTGSGSSNEFNVIGTNFTDLIFPLPPVFFLQEGYTWDTTTFVP